jgi:prevent-host-death family protein
MNAIRVAEDIVPIGAFKARASQWLKHAKLTGQPVVITQNGHPAGVVLSPAEYDRLQDRERFLADVAAGLADADAGRTLSLYELEARLAERREARGRV